MEHLTVTSPASRRLWSASILLVGLVVSALAAIVNVFFFALLLDLCTSHDTSPAPPPGSAGETFCNGLGPRWIVLNIRTATSTLVVFGAIVSASIAAPLVGGAIAARRNRWRPLAVGTVVAAATVLVAASLIRVVDQY